MTRLSPIVELMMQRGVGPALICEEGEISYGVLGAAIQATAQRMARAGVKCGSHVAVEATATFNFVVAYFATHLLGAVAIPLYPHLGAQTLAAITRYTRFSASFYGSAFPHRLPHRIAVATQPKGAFLDVKPELADPADLLFFTGSDGKVIVHSKSHATLSGVARMMSRFVGNRSTDRELIAAPLSHPFGLSRLRSVLASGGAAILCDGVHRPDDLFELMAKWRATGLSMLSSQWTLLEKLSGDELGGFASQIRYVEFGGRLTLERKLRLIPMLHRSRLCSSHGWPPCSHATYLSFRDAGGRLDSEGRATPEVQISVRDDHGSPLPAGKPGYIWVRRGADGWHCTGEIGHLDPQGFLYVEQRAEGMVDVGGWPVSTREIEAVLCAHPSIDEAIVTGAPDPVMGEVVAAQLHGARLSHDQLFAHVRRQLEPYKVPVRVQWTHVPHSQPAPISSRFS